MENEVISFHYTFSGNEERHILLQNSKNDGCLASVDCEYPTNCLAVFTKFLTMP